MQAFDFSENLQASFQQSRGQVLFVEDEEDYRDTLASLLETEGYEVIQAGNAEEGIAVLADYAPDIIISDINMPGMNGLEMLDTMRKEFPRKMQVPFVFLTAYGQQEEIVKGHECGIDDYIVKPADFELLSAMIDSRVKISRKRKSLLSNEVERLKSTLVDRLSHELRDPLNTVIGMSGLLLRKRDKALEEIKTQDFLERINSSGNNLLNIVDLAVDTIALHSNQCEMLLQYSDPELLVKEALMSVADYEKIDIENVDIKIDHLILQICCDGKYIARVVGLLTILLHRLNPESRLKVKVVRSNPSAGEIIISTREAIAEDSQQKNWWVYHPEEKAPQAIAGLVESNSIVLEYCHVVMQKHEGRLMCRMKDEGLDLAIEFPL